MNCYGNFHIILILYSEKYICGSRRLNSTTSAEEESEQGSKSRGLLFVARTKSPSVRANSFNVTMVLLATFCCCRALALFFPSAFAPEMMKDVG